MIASAVDELLFQDFIDNPSTYRACEQFWGRLTAGLADSLGQSGQWRPWMPRTYADGTPFPDAKGNPIHDGRSDRLDRAFRIIQQRAAGQHGELAAWLKYYEPEYPDLPRNELVLNLTLSRETAHLAEELLRKWMTPSTTPEEMKVFLAQRVRPGDAP